TKNQFVSRFRYYINTSKLLPGLEEDSSEDTSAVVSWAVLEAIDIRSLSNRLFVNQIGFDFIKFCLDFRSVDLSTQYTSETGSCLIVTTLPDQLTRRVG